MLPELNKIYTGDCLDIMRSWPDKCVDLVVTDPPYGIKRDKGFNGLEGFGGVGKPIARKRFEDNNWDSDIPSQETFQQIIRVSKNQMFFGGNFFAHVLPRSTHWIFWEKLQTMPTFGDGELIWTSFDKKSIKKYTFQYNGLLSASEDERQHPTQKPSELMGLIIRDYAEKFAVICDPFAGSGSTLVAAERNKHNWIGIEISPVYVHIAEDRILRERAQLKFNLKMGE